MDDRTRIALGLGVGAIAGGFVAFLLFTERGRAFRSEIEPQLEGLIGEAERLAVAFDRTRRAVHDGLATLTPVEGDARTADGDRTH